MQRGPIRLSQRWTKQLIDQPGTGMGYQIVTVRLRDGRKYKQTIVDSGYITRVRGMDHIPFTDEDIVEIIVTHDKWDFRTEPFERK